MLLLFFANLIVFASKIKNNDNLSTGFEANEDVDVATEEVCEHNTTKKPEFPVSEMFHAFY